MSPKTLPVPGNDTDLGNLTIVPVAVALTHLAKPIVPGAPPNWGEELIVVVGYSHRQVDVAYPYG
jgi:hypothetical protein